MLAPRPSRTRQSPSYLVNEKQNSSIVLAKDFSPHRVRPSRHTSYVHTFVVGYVAKSCELAGKAERCIREKGNPAKEQSVSRFYFHSLSPRPNAVFSERANQQATQLTAPQRAARSDSKRRRTLPVSSALPAIMRAPAPPFDRMRGLLLLCCNTVLHNRCHFLSHAH
jgi:hypothetical protein